MKFDTFNHNFSTEKYRRLFNDYYNNFARLFFRESGDKFIPNIRATLLNKYNLETIDNIAIKLKVDKYKFSELLEYSFIIVSYVFVNQNCIFIYISIDRDLA